MPGNILEVVENARSQWNSYRAVDTVKVRGRPVLRPARRFQNEEQKRDRDALPLKEDAMDSVIRTLRQC